jgi:hypothetical protein
MKRIQPQFRGQGNEFPGTAFFCRNAARKISKSSAKYRRQTAAEAERPGMISRERQGDMLKG